MNIEKFLELCANGTPKEVQKALKNGADVNASDETGVTALMCAAACNPDSEVVEILLENGADAHAKDKDGKRAIDHAREIGAETAALLIADYVSNMAPDSQNKYRTDTFYGGVVSSDIIANTQFSKYHTKTGHGFAAEDANALSERLRWKNVDKIGASNKLNGADRITNGQMIQTKYCATARETFNSFFDKEGFIRYENQLLEVPRDQHSEVIKLAKERIAKGELKYRNGETITDPNYADKLFKKGIPTYTQAKNIAKARNIDSIIFDVKNNAIVSLQITGISFGISVAKRCWNGEKFDKAIKAAIKDALAAGGMALATGVATSQILKTGLGRSATALASSGLRAMGSTSIGKKAIHKTAEISLGKKIYGAAAKNHLSKLFGTNSKLLGSNVVIAGITTAIVTGPDFYRAMFEKNISWTQFSKNLSVNVAGIAGGAAGFAAGTAVAVKTGLVGAKTGATAGTTAGTAITPGVGTIIGGVIGLAGGIAGGMAASLAAKSVADSIADDDSQKMMPLLQSGLQSLAHDYLLSEAECNRFLENIQSYLEKKSAVFFRDMYGYSSHDSGRTKYVYQKFENICEKIVSERPIVHIDESMISKAKDALLDWQAGTACFAGITSLYFLANYWEQWRWMGLKGIFAFIIAWSGINLVKECDKRLFDRYICAIFGLLTGATLLYVRFDPELSFIYWLMSKGIIALCVCYIVYMIIKDIREFGVNRSMLKAFAVAAASAVAAAAAIVGMAAIASGARWLAGYLSGTVCLSIVGVGGLITAAIGKRKDYFSEDSASKISKVSCLAIAAAIVWWVSSLESTASAARWLSGYLSGVVCLSIAGVGGLITAAIGKRKYYFTEERASKISKVSCLAIVAAIIWWALSSGFMATVVSWWPLSRESTATVASSWWTSSLESTASAVRWLSGYLSGVVCLSIAGIGGLITAAIGKRKYYFTEGRASKISKVSCLAIVAAIIWWALSSEFMATVVNWLAGYLPGVNR